MAWLKLIPLGFLLVSGAALADTNVYKYQIKSSLGISQSCTNDGEQEISQVRFFIDSDKLQSNQDIIAARVKISVCLWGGAVIKETHDLMVPRFMFVQAAPMQGAFPLKNSAFTKISVSELKVNTWQVRYFDKTGNIWSKMDPIEVKLSAKRGFPESLRFYVKEKKKWIEATFRLIEKQ